jgi:hypothetical protein
LDVWDGDHLSLVNWAVPTGAARGRIPDRAPNYAALLRRLADAGF